MSPFSNHILAFVQKHQRVLALALFPSLAILLFLRAPYALLHPQFWAEDSTVFFDQAAHLGIASLAKPHAGYLHEFPRLIAGVASALPSGLAPWVYGWSAYLAGLAAILLIAHSSVGGHRSFGLLAALAIAFTPHLSQEIFWSLTNVQWIFSAFLVVQLVADPPETGAMTCLRSAFSLLAGATSPLSAILLPVLLLRAWFVRNTRQVWPLGAAIVAGLLQEWTIVATGAGARAMHHPSAAACLEIIGRRVFIQGFFPAGLWPAAGTHPVFFAVAGSGLLLLGAILSRQSRIGCLLLLAASALLCFASIARAAASIPEMIDPANAGFGDRYFFPVRIAIILILLLMAFGDVRPLRIGAVVFLCTIPLASLPSFSAPAQFDREWGRYAPLIDAGKPADIPINPWWFGLYHYRPPAK